MLDHHISIGHNALRLGKDEFSIQEDRMFFTILHPFVEKFPDGARPPPLINYWLRQTSAALTGIFEVDHTLVFPGDYGPNFHMSIYPKFIFAEWL